VTFDYGIPAELFMGKRKGGPRRCHAADKRDELAPSQHCMSASDASAAG